MNFLKLQLKRIYVILLLIFTLFVGVPIGIFLDWVTGDANTFKEVKGAYKRIWHEGWYWIKYGKRRGS